MLNTEHLSRDRSGVSNLWSVIQTETSNVSFHNPDWLGAQASWGAETQATSKLSIIRVVWLLNLDVCTEVAFCNCISLQLGATHRKVKMKTSFEKLVFNIYWKKICVLQKFIAYLVLKLTCWPELIIKPIMFAWNSV